MAVAEQTGLMDKAEMKPLLMLSKRQPVSCVIGLTRDKQGVILLHRLTKPRKLLAEARKKAQEAGMDLDRATMRFGRASIDGATESGTVHFTVNKEAPKALRMKLIEQLRPAGFQRCEITVDEALETETEADDPLAAGAQQGAGADTPETAAATGAAGGGGDTSAGTGATGPEASAPDNAQPDTSAPDGSAGKTPSAGGPGPASGPGRNGAPHAPDSPVFEKGRKVWTAVRAKLQTDIDAVVKGAEASLGQGEDFAFVRECFEPIMKSLDDSLSAKLAEISAAKGDHTKLLGEAQAIIERYKSFVDSDPMVEDIDKNPFHPVALRHKLDPALTALSNIVKTPSGSRSAAA